MNSYSIIKKGVFIIIGSELIYQMYKKIKQVHKKNQCEINEAHFVSNFSKSCLDHPINFICSNKLCNINNIDRIVDYINAAQKNISLAMYIFTIKAIGGAIANAYDRGVDVKIITEETMAFSSGSEVLKLKDKGIPIRYKKGSGSNSIIHHKFCLLDVTYDEDSNMKKNISNVINENHIQNKNKLEIPDNGLLITGSLNWTLQGFYSNNENFIITSNKECVHSFANEFARMWANFDVAF